MKSSVVLALLISLLVATSLYARSENSKLWAGISVNQPVFSYEERTRVSITFSLVNDGNRAVDPKLDKSVLYINGKAWPDSDISFANGPRDNRFENLPPRDHLLLSMAMTDEFTKPGIYRLLWSGPGYKSSEICFRVLPKGK